jgi:hypothetical protein
MNKPVNNKELLTGLCVFISGPDRRWPKYKVLFIAVYAFALGMRCRQADNKKNSVHGNRCPSVITTIFGKRKPRKGENNIKMCAKLFEK